MNAIFINRTSSTRILCVHHAIFLLRIQIMEYDYSIGELIFGIWHSDVNGPLKESTCFSLSSRPLCIFLEHRIGKFEWKAIIIWNTFWNNVNCDKSINLPDWSYFEWLQNVRIEYNQDHFQSGHLIKGCECWANNFQIESFLHQYLNFLVFMICTSRWNIQFRCIYAL